MAGYLGYALKAGVEGFQTGFNMAQQKQEMEWKKAQMKKLEEKEKKIAEGSAIYMNLVNQVYADNVASEDELMKLNTAFLAAGYEVQAVIKDTHNAIQSMNKDMVEQDFALLELYADITDGLDPKDIQGTFDIFQSNVKSSKGLDIFEGYFNLQGKRHEIAEEEKPWERAAVLPAEVRPGYLREKGIEIPEVTPKALTVAQQKYDWATEAHQKWLIDPKDPEGINFEEYKKYMGVSVTPEESKGLEKQVRDIRTEGERAGIDPAKINKSIQDKILGTTAEVEPKPETVTTIKNWEKMFNIRDEEGPKTEEEYNRVLELLEQSEDVYKPRYATWKEALIAEVKGIAKDLKGITDKEDFNFLVDIYMQKLEEIKAKYPEVNLDQFPEFEEQKNWFEKLKEKVGL